MSLPRIVKDSNGASVTIQVCNHNYLLADAAHRQNGWKPLLKDYQALVIDEAHKLPETVRQMNTRRIRSSDLLHFEKILITSHCTLGAQKLRGARMAFLTAFAPAENDLEREKSFCLTDERSASLRHLDKTIQEILKLENKEVPPVLRNKLSDTQELVPIFLRSDMTFVRYVEYHQENGSLAIDLCAVPFDLPRCACEALWRNQKPVILTSGTLAVGEDFTHTKQQFGLDRGTALRTLRIASPFHYDENCLLYFPAPYRKKAPYKQDVDRVAHQIQELINTVNGHTLVLFTSYDQMGRVYEKLKDKFPVPVLQAQRNPQIYLERFKQLPNAVLFASGACWEGVDFPGDMVSLLIIVKLPFQVPDPLGEAMRKQYGNLHSYIRAEVVPEMQIKLRQGFGRAIRTETDSCVVAILDSRAAPGKRYHQAVLEALLVCRRALRKLRWPCVLELFAQAGTEEQPLSLRPGMVELLHAAANGEADVLVVVDAAHLYCGRPELEGLLASLLHYGVHTFGAKDGNWIEPGGRRWMVLPGYDEEVWNG